MSYLMSGCQKCGQPWSPMQNEAIDLSIRWIVTSNGSIGFQTKEVVDGLWGKTKIEP